MKCTEMRAATAIIALAAAGCGGGSGSSLTPPPVTNPPPTQGIEGTGIAIGPIEGFGSIFVNGIEFATDGAVYLLDDVAGSESELRVGQIVTVIGEIAPGGATGTAERVWFDHDVRGPVATIDLAAAELLVLGQRVVVGALTTFGNEVPGGDLDGLQPGDIVSVSGFVGGDGTIAATRIDLDAGGGPFEVRGIASAVDTANATLMINSLAVNYSGAMLEDFPSGMPADGDLVEASGTLEAGQLVATRLEHEERLPPVGEGDRVEVEGLVTRFASASDFDVAGVRFTTNAATEFRNGAASALAAGVLVEAEGSVAAGGVLVAERIEFGADGSVRLDGTVEAVDATAGRLTVFGLDVAVTSGTRIEDKSSADLRPFSVNDINPGDYVEIRAFVAAGGLITASRLEREDAEPEARLRGPVTAVSEPQFQVLGVTVTTDAGTTFSGTTASEFYASAAGRIVEARGNWDGARLQAVEVSFED